MQSSSEEDLLDTHLCLSCQCKMVGLDTYIRHKQVECSALKRRQMTLSQIDHFVNESCKLHADHTPTNFELVLSYPTFQHVVLQESDVNLVDADRCDVKHAADQDTAADMLRRDDESAVDCFFESLQLRSRYGHTHSSKDCYSQLFEHQIVESPDDLSIYSHQKLSCLDNCNILRVSENAGTIPVTSFGDCYSSTDIRLGTTASDMFSSSDNEDILNFTVGSMNTSQTFSIISDDLDKEKQKSKPQASSSELVVRCKDALTARVAGKWRPGERQVLRYDKHVSDTGNWQLHDEESDNEDNKCANEIICSDNDNVNKIVADMTDDSNVVVDEHPTDNDIEQYQANAHVGVSSSSGFQCSTCNIEYRSKYSYARHLLTQLHKRRAKGFCRTSLTSESVISLSAISDGHLETLLLRNKPFQCRVCQIFVDKKDELLQHVASEEHLRATRQISIRCVRCRYVAHQPADILTHLNTVDHGDTLRGCTLRKHGHRKSVKSLNISQACIALCEECPATFKSKSSLAIHRRRRHSHEKPFSCVLCFRSFCDNSSLTVHKKSDRHQKRFQLANTLSVTI